MKLKKTVKELRDKAAAKTSTKKLLSTAGKDSSTTNPIQDAKIKVSVRLLNLWGVSRDS